MKALAVKDIVRLSDVKAELVKSVSDELGINMAIAFLDTADDQTTTAERLVLLIDVVLQYHMRKSKSRP